MMKMVNYHVGWELGCTRALGDPAGERCICARGGIEDRSRMKWRSLGGLYRYMDLPDGAMFSTESAAVCSERRQGKLS